MKYKIHTPDQYRYQLLSSHGISFEQSSIKFGVKASHDVHVALLSSHDENHALYEIVLGGWDNTASVIRDAKQQAPKVEHKGHILSPYSFRNFEIIYQNGAIQVIEGDGKSIMTWTDKTSPLTIRDVGISTGFGASGDWTLPCPAGILFLSCFILLAFTV